MADIVVNGIRYALEQDGSATLKATSTIHGSVKIPTTVEKDGTRYPVKVIGANSFARQQHMLEVTFDDDSEVVAFNDACFEGAVALKKIQIPRKLATIAPYSFKDATAIESIVGGSEQFIIQNGILYTKNMNRLVLVPRNVAGEFVIKDTVHRVCPHALQGCANITSLKVSDETSDLSDFAFAGTGITTFNFSESISKINRGLFAGCTKLTSVTFSPNVGILTVNGGCFMDCPIERLCLPKSVITLATKALDQMYHLKELTFENGSVLKEIKEDAIRSTNVERIQIPASLTDLHVNNFFACAKIEEFMVSGDRFVWDKGVGVLYDQRRSTLHCVKRRGLQNIEIPESVKVIAPNAMHLCRSIQSVIFPERSDVVEIGGYAFARSGLTSIILPKKLETIGDEAFGSCYDLTTVKFTGGRTESNLKVIGHGAFSCSAIEAFDTPDKVESFGRRAFSSSKIKAIRIPAKVSAISGMMLYGCIELEKLVICDKVTIGEEGLGLQRGKPVPPRVVAYIGEGTGRLTFKDGARESPRIIVKTANNVDKMLVVEKPHPRAPPGSTIEDLLMDAQDYEVISELCHTGRVVVSKVHSKGDDPMVMIAKEFTDIQCNEDELRREICSLMCLDHPAILGIIGCVMPVAENNQHAVIVTEWLPHMSLDKVIYNPESRKFLTPTVIAKMAVGMAHGIWYMHASGVFHRDLKPGNIFVDWDWHIRIGDLGSTKFIDATITETFMKGFTAMYMAPEVADSKGDDIDAAVDIYSYCLIVLEIITGAPWYKHIPNWEKLTAPVLMQQIGSGKIRPDFAGIEMAWAKEWLETGLACDKSDRDSLERMLEVMETNEYQFVPGDVDVAEVKEYYENMKTFWAENQPKKVVMDW